MSLAFASYGQTPTYVIIEKLPQTEWSKKEKGADLSNQEKLNLLKQLPEGERVEFEMDYDEETKETTYWELSPYGLYYLDLDFDGDLDLLYSAQNGTMSQTATKVYYNNNNVLEYTSYLRDGLIDIKKNDDSYNIYTLFQPCCGSYTTRIDQYRFSKVDTAIFKESISIIGRSYFPYKGMLDFTTKTTKFVKNPSLYGLPADFKNASAYFGKRNKEIRAKLKAKEKIELIKVEGSIEVGVLGKTTFKEEDYFLVITQALNKLPNMPASLYEWSQGNGRRLVGWVKATEME